jgi:hypothetical protein
VLGATASAGIINWYSASTGGASIGTGTSFTTPSLSATTTYYVDATNGICTTATRTTVIATVTQLPSIAGSITGPTTFTPGTTGVSYSIAPITGAIGYVWNYTGSGVTINGSGNNVTLDFSISATAGTLSVYGTNSCGNGIASTLNLTQGAKTLTVTFFLEGLYNGANGLVKVQDCDDGENSFDLFSGIVADTLTVELAQTTSPYTTVFRQHGVPVNTNGTVSLTSVPGGLSGNYHIVIKHRNHVETWSQSTSFAGSSVSFNFTNAISKAWGNNMVRTGSVYCIYCGDANRDQYVDGFDLAITFNNNKLGSYGYQLSDINGDGFVDGFDLARVFNNNKKGAGMITPLAPMKKK